MSALSTVAIKDGHRGSTHPHAYPFPGANPNHPNSIAGNVHPNPNSTSHTSMLAAERADRISRLPGFAPNMGSGAGTKSTVGSASATGSVGRTVDGSYGDGTTDGGSVTEGDQSEYMDMDRDDGTDRGMDDASQADTDMAVDGGSERASTVGGGSQHGGSQHEGSTGGERGSGTQQAERILRSRGLDGEQGGKGLHTPEGEGLGKFYFEDKNRR